MFDLKRFRKDKKIQQKELADILSLTQGHISQIEAGKRALTDEYIDILKENYSDIDEYITNTLQSYSEFGTPVYDIDATCGLEIRDLRDERIIGRIDLSNVSKEAVIIFATGDSMLPLIKDGAMIAIREIKNWDIIIFGQVYLIVTAEYRLIKYIKKHQDKNYVILRSENSLFEDIELPKDKILKLFLVENVLSVKNLI